MSIVRRMFLAAALSIGPFISTAEATPDTFFGYLSGSWSGSGKAYTSKYGEVSASCRALGLSIRNAGGNRYVGTYTGSTTGPARLEGTLRGDRLVMTIRWGALVNGDRTAQMVLERTGPDSFAQIVNDKVEGKNRSTSSFAFVRANKQAVLP